MNNNQPSFLGLAVKTIVVHTVTYFLMGALASTFLNLPRMPKPYSVG